MTEKYLQIRTIMNKRSRYKNQSIFIYILVIICLGFDTVDVHPIAASRPNMKCSLPIISYNKICVRQSISLKKAIQTDVKKDAYVDNRNANFR